MLLSSPVTASLILCSCLWTIGGGQMLHGYHRDPLTPEVVTPHIDSLVKEGLELDQHCLQAVLTISIDAHS